MGLKQIAEKLEEFLADTGLEVENVGREPTDESIGNSTIIDITFTKNLKTDILEWMVDRRFNASDHNTMKFRVGKEKINLENLKVAQSRLG